MNTDITKQMEMVLYRTEDDNVTVSALIKDETIWLTQKAMAEFLNPVNWMRKWLLQKLQQPLSTEQCRIKRRLFLPIITI